MSLKSILFAGTAVAALIAAAMPASAGSYDDCSYSCYDDQAGETRQLNLMAFQEARLQRVADYDDGDDDEWGWTGHDGDDDDDDDDAYYPGGTWYGDSAVSPWHDDGDDDDDGDDGDDD